MTDWLVHLPICPVVIPLFAGGLLILVKDAHRRLRLGIAFASVLLMVPAFPLFQNTGLRLAAACAGLLVFCGAGIFFLARARHGA